MDIATVSKIIQNRKSFYTGQMDETLTIPDEDIWKLLENANYAPSHKRTEPWRYIVFSGNSLTELYEEQARIYLSITPESEIKPAKVEKLNRKATILSHAIAICMKRDEKECVPIEEEEYAVACSVQNILLSMDSLNIIGYWGTGKIAFSDEMKKYLKLGKQDKCLGFLQLGVPKDGLPKIQKQQMSGIREKVEWR